MLINILCFRLREKKKKRQIPFSLLLKIYESFLIELDFPATPMTDLNSTEVLTIFNALNDASMIDIKKTTTKNDIVVMHPYFFFLI